MEPHCEHECHCTQQADGDDDFDEAKSFTLDTGSTFNSANNEELLTGVSRGKKAMQMSTNAGSRIANVTGQMPGMEDEMWCDNKSKANVFSFLKMAKNHRITCDTEKENTFDVHADKGVVKFKVNKVLEM